MPTAALAALDVRAEATTIVRSTDLFALRYLLTTRDEQFADAVTRAIIGNAAELAQTESASRPGIDRAAVSKVQHQEESFAKRDPA